MTDQYIEESLSLQGIPVSAGIITGRARLVERSREKIIYQLLINENEINKEVERFNEALKLTREQLVAVRNRMSEQIREHAFILDTHLMVMDDNMITDSTIETILEEKINAEWALKKSVQKIRHLFEEMDYEYIRDRINDVENVAERILRNLAGKEPDSLSAIEARVIIVAHDLSPADTSELDTGKVMGFITEVGGRTSHTAIMAKALKIPAVVGLESVTRKIHDGDLLIVDGYSGAVVIRPDDETIIEYEEKQAREELYRSSILKLTHLPAETVDGHKIRISANIELLKEVSAAKDYGVEGIGLYRTEFLYLGSKGVPDEEALFEDYKEVAETILPESVTIRTLDLGGDKLSSYMNVSRETNPALGLRAIRLCLKEQDIFRSQLRAILRASAFGKIRLMFPMISGLQELLHAKEILDEVREELDAGNVDYDHGMQVGIMIEVPSAVAISDILARHVDFFSIGTNDLIQYALAIDRVNEHVAYMYEPYHPAVIRMIHTVVKAAREQGIGVSLCGEVAGDPFYALILLGIGVKELSMNVGSVPLLKKTIRSISMADAKSSFNKMLELTTSKEVRKFLEDKMGSLVPDINEKDFYLKISADNHVH